MVRNAGDPPGPHITSRSVEATETGQTSESGKPDPAKDPSDPSFRSAPEPPDRTTISAGSTASQRLTDPLAPGVIRTQATDGATHLRMSENISGGLRYAGRLSNLGLQQPAEHVAFTFHQLAPDAVPAPKDLDWDNLGEFADSLRITEQNRGGSLFDLVSFRNGDTEAETRLTHMLGSGDLQIRAFGEEPETPPEKWDFSVGLWTHNDNLAFIRDGKYRSDDGPTASFGGQLRWETGDRTEGEMFNLDFGHNMFTERELGGMDRMDLVEIALTKLKTRPVDRVFFDTLTTGWTVGLQGTGDFGGAKIQDGFHSLMEGTAMGGRRLGNGLQDNYASSRQFALLLGAEAYATKRTGLFEFRAGGAVQAPIGPTGVGRIGPDLQATLGSETGPYLSTGIGAGYQWVQGDALEFDGAPIEGFVASPRVGLGWNFKNWNVGLQWQGNHWGTQEGFGDMNGESVAITFAFGRGR